MPPQSNSAAFLIPARSSNTLVVSLRAAARIVCAEKPQERQRFRSLRGAG